MNKYLLFSLILFFVFDIILLTKYIRLRGNNIELYRENNLLVEMINDIPYYVVKNVRYENHSIYVNHEEIDSEIFQFKGTSYKLFYRIDFPFCENCIYPTLDKLNEFANEIGKDKIVILTSFPSKEFEEKFYSKIPVYQSWLLNLIKMSFHGCCMAFRKELLDYVMPFPKSLIAHDNWIGMCSCLKKNKIGYIDCPLIQYRRHHYNVSPTKQNNLNPLWFKLWYRMVLFFQLMRKEFGKR